MKNREEKKIEKKLKLFEEVAEDDSSREEKLDNLVMLLEASDLNSDELEVYSQKVNSLVEKKKKEKFRKFYDISSKDNKSREELIDRFEFLLHTSEFDSDDAMQVIKEGKTKTIVKYAIGFLFIILGFSMIVLPAPKYFEMFTIFYFDSLESIGINTYSLGIKGHGITIMDIISLIIVFAGIYILISVKSRRHT